MSPGDEYFVAYYKIAVWVRHLCPRWACCAIFLYMLCHRVWSGLPQRRIAVPCTHVHHCLGCFPLVHAYARLKVPAKSMLTVIVLQPKWHTMEALCLVSCECVSWVWFPVEALEALCLGSCGRVSWEWFPVVYGPTQEQHWFFPRWIDKIFHRRKLLQVSIWAVSHWTPLLKQSDTKCPLGSVALDDHWLVHIIVSKYRNRNNHFLHAGHGIGMNIKSNTFLIPITEFSQDVCFNWQTWHSPFTYVGTEHQSGQAFVRVRFETFWS